MAGRRTRGWREEAAARLLVRHLPARGVEGPALVMEDPLPVVPAALDARGLAPVSWRRRAWGGAPASPWPPPGPFGTAALRLPRSREELRMLLHAAASVLRPGGRVFVYGAGDEGIASALGPLEELFGEGWTLATGGRCRVLEARRPEALPGLRGSLESWRELLDPGHPGLRSPWVSYPGVFAHRRLDPGTRLLLDHLPPLPPGARVLDFGCGSGVVGALARSRGEGLRLELSDVDAVALEAARENVPGARTLLREGLPPPEGEPLHAILSNPPFHRGKAETLEAVLDLIRGAPPLLVRDGALVLVAQRRLSLAEPFRESFREVALLAEDRSYRVWEGRRPHQR